MHGASRAEAAGQLQQQAAAFHCRARPLSWSLAGSDLESNADQTTDWVTNAGKLAMQSGSGRRLCVGSGAVTLPISKMSRPDARPGRALSATTHGLHHFLSDSVLSIVNSHLCAIRRARSHLFHVCAFVCARVRAFMRTHRHLLKCSLDLSSSCA